MKRIKLSLHEIPELRVLLPDQFEEIENFTETKKFFFKTFEALAVKNPNWFYKEKPPKTVIITGVKL